MINKYREHIDFYIDKHIFFNIIKKKRGINMILIGNVTKGMGTAKKFINMMQKSFYEKTNIKLYPGTLNVKLNEPYILIPDYIVKPEEYGGTFNVQIQKCKVLDENAYLVRSEKNTKDQGDYGQDIIEIVSNVNFREKYNLKDGDRINILIQ